MPEWTALVERKMLSSRRRMANFRGVNPRG